MKFIQDFYLVEERPINRNNAILSVWASYGAVLKVWNFVLHLILAKLDNGKTSSNMILGWSRCASNFAYPPRNNHQASTILQAPVVKCC
jgi:hypothetical protein